MEKTCINCQHCWHNPTNDLHGYWCDRDCACGAEPWFGNMDFLGYEEVNLTDEMACFAACYEAVK